MACLAGVIATIPAGRNVPFGLDHHLEIYLPLALDSGNKK
jgi:hypothetical protein